jgi:hypothetical protein
MRPDKSSIPHNIILHPNSINCAASIPLYSNMHHSLTLSNLRRRLGQRLVLLLPHRRRTRSRQRVCSRICFLGVGLLLLNGRCKRLWLTRLDCGLLVRGVCRFRDAVGVWESLWESLVGRGSCSGTLEGRNGFRGSPDGFLSPSYKASSYLRGIIRYVADCAVCATYDASGDSGCTACYTSDGLVYSTDSSSNGLLRSSNSAVHLVTARVLLRAQRCSTGGWLVARRGRVGTLDDRLSCCGRESFAGGFVGLTSNCGTVACCFLLETWVYVSECSRHAAVGSVE